jgi:hypothetical protein
MPCNLLALLTATIGWLQFGRAQLTAMKLNYYRFNPRLTALSLICLGKLFANIVLGASSDTVGLAQYGFQAQFKFVVFLELTQLHCPLSTTKRLREQLRPSG